MLDPHWASKRSDDDSGGSPTKAASFRALGSAGRHQEMKCVMWVAASFDSFPWPHGINRLMDHSCNNLWLSKWIAKPDKSPPF